jgi:hypothetical protein
MALWVELKNRRVKHARSKACIGAYLGALILFSIAILPTATLAQEEVKRALFDDCEKAKEEYSRLAGEERVKLLDFFARIVALSTQSPSAPEAFAVAPSAPLGPDGQTHGALRTPELAPGALWQMTDAKRELRAKRCALELLQASGEAALGVLPKLVATYSEQVLSDEIAVTVEEVCAHIAEAAHTKGLAPSNEDLLSIVRFVISPHPLVARNAVHEYRDLAIPLLIREFGTEKLSLSQAESDYLRSIDPDGSIALKALIKLTTDLPPDRVKATASLLPIPSKSAIPSLVGDLVQLVAKPELQDSFLPVLGAACLELNGLTLDPNQQLALARLDAVFDPSILSAAQAACLARSNPLLGKRTLELLSKEAPAERQSYGLEIVRATYQSLPAETKRDLYTAISALAFNYSSPLSPDALSTLGQLSDHRGETNLAVYNALKALKKDSLSAKLSPNYEPLLSLLNTIGFDKDPQRFAPFILEALKLSPPSAAAATLAVKSPYLDRELIKLALTTPPTQLSASALDILSKRRDLPPSLAPQLAELLRYSELHQRVEQALIVIGKPAVAAIRKVNLRNLPPSAKLSALFTLTQLKAATRGELNELVNGIAAQTECVFTASHPRLFCARDSANQIDDTTRQTLSSELQRCLAAFSAESLRAVMECAPELVGESATAALKTLDAERDEGWLEQLVAIATEIDPPTAESQKLLSALLQRGSGNIKQRILTHLGPPTPLSEDVRAAVITQAQATPTAGPLQLSALKALALHADREYDWPEFIKQAIEGAGKGQLDREASRVISLIPEDIVLAEVIPALESDDSQRLIGAALVGSAVGSKAIPIVSRLWHLRDHRDPTVRFAISLALLRINPLTPDLSDTVRKLLVNRYFPLAQNLPIDWSKTVAVNDLDKGSFGTLRRDRLDLLLKSATLNAPD